MSRLSDDNATGHATSGKTARVEGRRLSADSGLWGAIALVALLLVSGFATFSGLVDLVSSSSDGEAVGLWTQLYIAIASAIVAACQYFAYVIAVRRGSLAQRFAAVASSLLLTIWSVTLGYGFWWKQLAERSEISAQIERQREDIAGYLESVALRLAVATNALDSLSSASNERMQAELDRGGTCGVASSTGRGPLWQARNEITIQVQVSTREIEAAADDFHRSAEAFTQAKRPEGMSASDFMELQAARAKSDGSIVQAKVASAAAALASLANRLEIQPNERDFFCYDLSLRDPLARSVAALNDLSSIRQQPLLEFRTGAHASTLAIQRLISSVAAWLWQPTATSANTNTNTNTNTQTLTGLDSISLVAAMTIDFSIFFLVLMAPQPRRPIAMVGRHTKRYTLSPYVAKTIARRLTDYTVQTADGTFVVLPAKDPDEQVSADEAEVRLLAGLLLTLQSARLAKQVDTTSGFAAATGQLADLAFALTGKAIGRRAKIKAELQEAGRHVGSISAVRIFDVDPDALINLSLALESPTNSSLDGVDSIVEVSAAPAPEVAAVLPGRDTPQRAPQQDDNADSPTNQQSDPESAACETDDTPRPAESIDVFISYKKEDRQHAAIFAHALAEEGLAVWWDPRLVPGDIFDSVIAASIARAQTVLVLWSPLSVDSDWVRNEALIGYQKKGLIPVLVGNCDPPMPYKLVQTQDLVGWDGDRQDESWRAVVMAIRGKLTAQAGSVVAQFSMPKGAAVRSVASPESQSGRPNLPYRPAGDDNYWNSIRDTSDPAEFDAYLLTFPDGLYASLARIRRDRLLAAGVT